MTVLLASGGIDSSTAAAVLRNQGEDLLLLHIDYGQIPAGREQAAVRQIAQAVGTGNPLFVRLDELRPFGLGSLAGVPAMPGRPPDELPFRNALLAVVAAMVAAKTGSSSVAMGLIDAANAVHPDCRPEFVAGLRSLFGNQAPAIEVLVPLVELKKADVARLAVRLGVPLGLTFSCNASAVRHCWACPGCLDREEALLAAGVAA